MIAFCSPCGGRCDEAFQARLDAGERSESFAEMGRSMLRPYEERDFVSK
jgi:hypothetical protein